jgi:hypothetical protein
MIVSTLLRLLEIKYSKDGQAAGDLALPDLLEPSSAMQKLGVDHCQCTDMQFWLVMAACSRWT